jgi:hypothetical protein
VRLIILPEPVGIATWSHVDKGEAAHVPILPLWAVDIHIVIN